MSRHQFVLCVLAPLRETLILTLYFAAHSLPVAADEPLPAEVVSFTDGEAVDFAPRPNDWDAAFRERGAIVRLDDGTLRLYYTGYDGTREGIKRIGLAISTDNGRSWTRAYNLPVTPEGLWVEDPSIVRHDGQWYMFAEGLNDQAQLLSSPDGIRWRAHGLLDVRSVDGNPIPPGPYGTPTAYFHDGVWQLLYERRDAGIWLARSTDLKTWTNVTDEPVLSPGPEGFDAAMIALNQVIHRDGQFIAYYHGADRLEKPRDWAVGVATSSDLVTWSKYDGNPITDPKANVSSGTVLFLDGPERAPTLFTTHAAVRVHPPTATAP